MSNRQSDKKMAKPIIYNPLTFSVQCIQLLGPHVSNDTTTDEEELSILHQSGYNLKSKPPAPTPDSVKSVTGTASCVSILQNHKETFYFCSFLLLPGTLNLSCYSITSSIFTNFFLSFLDFSFHFPTFTLCQTYMKLLYLK